MEGKVKFFDETRGFGFIVESISGDDYFVHKSNLVDKITKGNDVTFELEKGQKGPKAVNVKLKVV